MSVALRLLMTCGLLALLWPSLPSYRASQQLAEASTRVERALRGIDRGEQALQSMRIAGERLDAAAAHLPGDARVPLLRSVTLILTGRAVEAEALLRTAIERGERAELTLSLGRALAAQGDDQGAHQAFLRSAWASPAAIATLPAALRTDLRLQVAALEDDLRRGRLPAPPALPD